MCVCVRVCTCAHVQVDHISDSRHTRAHKYTHTYTQECTAPSQRRRCVCVCVNDFPKQNLLFVYLFIQKKLHVYTLLAPKQEKQPLSSRFIWYTHKHHAPVFLFRLGRVLAVSFLLGFSSDPNRVDRWNGTCMDDCLRGGTLYHKYCAKLLQGWAGEIGTFKGTQEGEIFTQPTCSIRTKNRAS